MGQFRFGWERPSIETYAMLPLSALYALGWSAYRAVYSLGLKKPYEPHVPVVTVGNLMVGGTGKTPMTLFVRDCLRALGREVVVSASGYGSPASRGASLAPEGRLDARRWGDEPAMLRDERPETPLIVGRDRVEVARICSREFPEAVLLMDDGFQHLRLRQHVTLVLDPPEPPNAYTLPAGPYREPRGSGRMRADMMLPGEFQVVGSPTKIRTTGGEPVPWQQARTTELQLLCALGRPWALHAMLEAQGFHVGTARFLPDHDRLDAGSLLKQFDPGKPLLVTSKDWVKLRERGDLGDRTIWIASYDLAVEPVDEFKQWLGKRLDEATA